MKGSVQQRTIVTRLLIVLEFKDMSTLVGLLPDKGRKEILEEMKQRGREERGTGKKVKKQKKKKPISPLPLPATRIADLAQQ